MKILTFDVEDWFHILDNDDTRGPMEWRNFPARAEASCRCYVFVCSSSFAAISIHTRRKLPAVRTRYLQHRWSTSWSLNRSAAQTMFPVLASRLNSASRTQSFSLSLEREMSLSVRNEKGRSSKWQRADFDMIRKVILDSWFWISCSNPKSKIHNSEFPGNEWVSVPSLRRYHHPLWI